MTSHSPVASVNRSPTLSCIGRTRVPVGSGSRFFSDSAYSIPAPLYFEAAENAGNRRIDTGTSRYRQCGS